MFYFYNILLLSLCFTYSLSNDIQSYYPNQTVVSSRSIYELVKIRHAAAKFAAYHNRTHRNNNTNNINQLDKKILKNNIITPKSNTADVKINHHQILFERLKIVIVISTIAVVSLIITVIICIFVKYHQAKGPVSTERAQQKIPLHSSKQSSRTYNFSEKNRDKRKFSRKSRTLPTAV